MQSTSKKGGNESRKRLQKLLISGLSVPLLRRAKKNFTWQLVDTATGEVPRGTIETIELRACCFHHDSVYELRSLCRGEGVVGQHTLAGYYEKDELSHPVTESKVLNSH